jgi:excisionase family DNA binding protein
MSVPIPSPDLAPQPQLADLVRSVEGLQREIAALRAALPQQLLTLRQAARMLGVGYSTLRRWVKDGDVPCVRVGRTTRIDAAVVRARSREDIAALASRT